LSFHLKMSWWACNGRECKLGWGWNQSLSKLIPVEDTPVNATSKTMHNWNCCVYLLSSDILHCWKTISLFLEPSCRRKLNFQIVFDDIQYWQVECCVYRRRETSKKFPNYPPSCSHFIKEIYYGVDLWLYFPKSEFPEEKEEVKTLFEKRNFNEAQEKIKCKVFINWDEVKEMTIGEFSKFMNELDEGEHTEYDTPVIFCYEKLPQEIRETVISNERNFCDFLSYLYSYYRKIEIKMEQAGCPDFLPDLDHEEKSFAKIVLNLEKMKEEYKLMKKDDFSKMYPILKKLFFCYIDYIRYSVDHQIDMYEGDELPGIWKEIGPWLKSLNN